PRVTDGSFALMLRSRAFSAFTRIFKALRRGVSKDEGIGAPSSLETAGLILRCPPSPFEILASLVPQDEGGLPLPPGQPLACLRDHPRQSVLVGRRHHVSPRDAGDRRKLFDELDRDAFTLGGRIGGAVQPLDEVLRNDGAVEALLHPARRSCRAQRCN